MTTKITKKMSEEENRARACPGAGARSLPGGRVRAPPGGRAPAAAPPTGYAPVSRDPGSRALGGRRPGEPCPTPVAPHQASNGAGLTLPLRSRQAKQQHFTPSLPRQVEPRHPPPLPCRHLVGAPAPSQAVPWPPRARLRRWRLDPAPPMAPLAAVVPVLGGGAARPFPAAPDKIYSRAPRALLARERERDTGSLLGAVGPTCGR
jgi:hypothetical protein